MKRKKYLTGKKKNVILDTRKGIFQKSALYSKAKPAKTIDAGEKIKKGENHHENKLHEHICHSYNASTLCSRPCDETCGYSSCNEDWWLES